jgi:phosphoglycolate phosphatase
VISNKEQLLLEREIDHLYPTVNFAFIFGNGAANKNKPDPAPLIMAAKQMGTSISEQSYYHIGDSKQDTDAAIASGAKPILIGSGKFFKKGKSDRIVNIYSPCDLLPLIQVIT